MKKFFLLLVLVPGWLFCRAADTTGLGIPIGRQWIHEAIDREQGEAVRMIKSVSDSGLFNDEQQREATLIALTSTVDQIQTGIEEKDLGTRRTMVYLSALDHTLTQFVRESRFSQISPGQAPELIRNFQEMMHADLQDSSVAACVIGVPYQIARINLEGFDQNFGYRVGKAIIYREYAADHPDSVLAKLLDEYAEFLNEPFTDTIIARIARDYPVLVYTYATSFTPVGQAIRRNPDSLVHQIVLIGKSQDPIRLLPFLDYLASGQYTISGLEKISRDDDAYYGLVVRTMMDMSRRKTAGEHVIGMQAMEDEVKVRSLKYVREVNDLHESPDPIRFASIDKFTPEELYYMLINGEEEIYTSSYVGVFDRMMQRMNPPHGDELLMSVYFDKFRRFLSMAAAYNTLDTFLHSMNEMNSTTLMQYFITGLEQTPDIEDAVDVADAFGSINDPVLNRFLEHEVELNFLRVSARGDVRGKVIYAILAKLFHGRESSDQDSVWSRDIASRFNLPPLDVVPYSSLLPDTGKTVYEEAFFYADKDGYESFNSFKTDFPKGLWRMYQPNKYWMMITSTKGKPVTIYVKLPMATPDDDDSGQNVLTAYLDTKDIHPTVYIHRGHSYHVEATISQIQNTARLVMLGSCGGYNSLAGVLDIAPDAQIISSKQTGSMFVNEPIIRIIEENIRTGKNLDWINIWAKLNQQFRADPRYFALFQDYIPPYKNMGAIFIKAYRKLVRTSEIATSPKP
ncbi:MAG TPA: hypothetical protein VMV20_03915 [Chitinophagaceae bacterium]|nr:hypothetical protein [Chitinophagaceae bacterium]